MPEPIYIAAFDGVETHLEHTHERDVTVKEGGLRGKFQELALLRDIAAMQLDGIYIDGGANIGNHSLFFLTHCPHMTALISIEAHPTMAKILDRNVKRNFPDGVNWTGIQAALERHGKKTCHLSSIVPGNAGRTKIVRKPNDGAKETEVACITLDAINDSVNHRNEGFSGYSERISLLKLDVEDSECQAIEGGTQLLIDHRPVIVAEHHNKEFFDRFESLVRPFGYKVTAKKYDPRGETRVWLPSL